MEVPCGPVGFKVIPINESYMRDYKQWFQLKENSSPKLEDYMSIYSFMWSQPEEQP